MNPGGTRRRRRGASLDWGRRWLANRSRLGAALLISGACHLAAAWLVRIEPPLVSGAPRPAAPVQYLAPEQLTVANASAEAWLALEDPTLLALPSLSGFSRRWLDRRPLAARRPLEPQPPRLDLVWAVPARSAAAEGGAARAPRAAEERWVPGLLEPVLQRPAQEREAAAIPRVEWLTAPRSGAAAAIAPPPFAAAEERMQAASTRYRVGATAAGQVRYVLVDRSCGDPELDRWGARELRRQLPGPETGAAPAIEWSIALVHWSFTPRVR